MIGANHCCPLLYQILIILSQAVICALEVQAGVSESFEHFIAQFKLSLSCER